MLQVIDFMTTSTDNKKFIQRAALLISIYFPPEPGGAASAAWNRATILHKIGYNVYVLCGFPSYPSGKVNDSKYKNKFFCIEKENNFTLIRLRLLPIKSKGYLRRLVLFFNFIFLTLFWMPKILKVVKTPELVYAITPTLFSSLIGKVYSKFTKSFLIYESSDLWPEQLVAIKTNLFFVIRHLGRILAKVSYTLPDMIIVTSQLAAEYVTRKYHPKAFVYSLPLGIDLDTYQKMSKDASRKTLVQNHIIPEDLKNKFIVLYAGTLNRVTKVENLFYAASRLKDGKNDIFFLVIGEGDEKEKLEEMKRKEEINNLDLLSFPPRRFVPEIISSADVCVVTLSPEPPYQATIPTKFFDYLACQRPQIGICEGELANLINSNKIGATVKDGEIDKLVNTILHFRESSTLLQEMEKNSRSVLERFSLESLAPKLEDVLKKRLNW